VLLALTISATVAKTVFGFGEGQIAPTPGAISASVNATSMSNIMQTLVPIGAYFGLNNKTFDVGIHESNILYSFDFNDVHIIEATGFTEKVFEYVPGTDNVHVRIGGVNVSSTIDADLTALKFIPFKSSGVNITNLALDLEFASSSDDNVHWVLKENVGITFDKLSISMENDFLNYLVRMSSSIINSVIKNIVIPAAKSKLTGVVDNLNKMIANEQAMDFEVPLDADNTTALNLTMTSAPSVKGSSNLITVNFDGLVDKMPSLVSNKDIRGDIKTFAPRLEHSNSEQIWVHEDTFASLIKNGQSKVFPMEIAAPA
jgi:hypothetical protein